MQLARRSGVAWRSEFGQSKLMAQVDPNNEAGFEVHSFPSDLKEACRAKDAIIARLRQHQFDEQSLFGITLALEEALTNAVKHGNCCDCTKPVTVRYSVNAEKAIIIVRDEGGGFCPDDVPDCTSSERIAVPNGRGIMLIRAYMDEVSYRADGREVYMVKRRNI